MRNKIFIIAFVLFFPFLISSCNDKFASIQKSPDVLLKYKYAKEFYQNKKYDKAISLLNDILLTLKGTTYGEEALYLLGKSYFSDKRYFDASEYFQKYISSYPNGEYYEDCLFSDAYGMYLLSPDPRLDQSSTYASIERFSAYLTKFPKSSRSEEIKKYLFEMQEKLAEKDLLTSLFYFNLGSYMGGSYLENNYQACIILSKEAVKKYPYTQFFEDFQILIFKSEYKIATLAAKHLKPVMFRKVIDEYYNYKNLFPEGKFMKEANRYLENAKKYATSDDNNKA